MDRMLDRLQIKSFCRLGDFRPIAKASYTVLTIQQIIETYNYIIRRIGNYFYPMISRVKDLIRIIYILEYSAYMTIAKKLSTKLSKIREKYGKPLRITITQIQRGSNLPSPIESSKTLELLSYMEVKRLGEQLKTNLKNKRYKEAQLINSDVFNPMYKINWRTLRNLNCACCICGSIENIEMHHVNAIRKGKVEGFTQVMKQLNRKQIPLCHHHHMAAEKGLLNKITISELYFLDQFLA